MVISIPVFQMRKQAQTRASGRQRSDLGEGTDLENQAHSLELGPVLGDGEKKMKIKTTVDQGKTCPDMADWPRKMRLI